MKKLSLILLSIVCLNPLFASDDDTILSVGNLAMPPSQQPGPLIGFGENIIPQNDFQFYLLGDVYFGKNQYFIDAVPGILYGIRDDLSIFFNVPIAETYKINDQRSSGLEDMFLQLEYAYYVKNTPTYANQATILVNASFPTGSIHKNPATGYGSMSYFVGTTFSQVRTDWIFFTAYGGLFTTSHKGTRLGDQFLYQYGIGKNITYNKAWIVSWLLELDGTYYWRNNNQGIANRNSGGNVIYLTPSLWISSPEWIIQLGAGYAIFQNLLGQQNRNTALVAFNIGRTF